MHENAVMITLNGRGEALVFTTAALKRVQDKFGGIAELTEAFCGPQIEEWDTPEERETKRAQQAKAQGMALEICIWLVALLANQGRMLEDLKAELLTEQQVGLYMMPKDIKPLMQACMDAIAKGSGTYHENDEVTDPLLEEALKNAEGAGN